ncbi:MAG: methylated-DNA--[protein]-cysteine S-methyltransferase [Planctomycetota bacterium]
MTDYERVAQILHYLDEHHAETPDLAAIARQAKLSPAHFHRLFARWAATTPKRFLQSITVRHAKELLRRGASVLETAYDVGLSSPGRLHDLTITFEAASPGELKSGGGGWTLQAGFAETTFGTALIASGPRGICHLSFCDASATEARGRAALADQWPAATVAWDARFATQLAAQIFMQESPVQESPETQAAPRRAGEAATPAPLKAFVRGSAFQLRVWRALLEIPEGALTSYGALATAIGEAGAARAVGSAVGKNPLGYLIPCHRVIRRTGAIGEYRWGADRKRAMLARESAGSLREPIVPTAAESADSDSVRDRRDPAERSRPLSHGRIDRSRRT